jgi:hypothetical protein
MARAVLWAYGFDGSAGEVEAAVDTIGPLPFDTVILPFIHVHEGIELYYNDTPLEALWQGLPAALERLKRAFPVKKQLLFSVGPFQEDFDEIGTDYQAFVKLFADFASGHHIDGMDLDYEGSYTAEDARLLGLIAKRYREQAGTLMTAAPYMDEAFWTGEGGVLAQAAGAAGNAFDWFNVQFYAGPGNLPPQDYLSTFDIWASAVGRPGNGVTDTPQFIVPGCNGTKEAGRSFSPTNLYEGLRAIREQPAPIGGAFVWNYQDLEWTPLEWAKAIVEGCR